MDRQPCYVAVHIGAGYHGIQKEKMYKSVIKQACSAAMERLKQGASANDAVECAIKVLEDAPITNAGLGSNLNRAGQVECDAAIMCSNPDAFGAVGATTAICNPIQAANAIMKANSKGPDAANGLVPPMFLAGRGADAWAETHGVNTSANIRHLITDQALNKYSGYMDRAFSESPKNTTNNNNDDLLLDTVGAVCIDSQAVVAAGVSSGGIALKYPGRIGEAAMFGCGCWAERQELDIDVQLVGCSVSGMGEQIMRTMLARECAQRQGDIFTTLDSCFENFCTTPSLSAYSHRNAGLVILRQTPHNENTAELGVAHTTQSMGYGYMSSTMKNPCARISRKHESDRAAITAKRL